MFPVSTCELYGHPEICRISGRQPSLDFSSVGEETNLLVYKEMCCFLICFRPCTVFRGLMKLNLKKKVTAKIDQCVLSFSHPVDSFLYPERNFPIFEYLMK